MVKEKNHSIFFFVVIAGTLILNPLSFSETPNVYGEEYDTEVEVGRSLELSFLLAKEPEPENIQLDFEIKHGNEEIQISSISFNNTNNQISFEKNKYFETAYAEFYYDENSIEVVFQIYFAKALTITGFTVIATDEDGDSSEIFVDKSINVKRAKKTITLHSIAEYIKEFNFVREPLSSIEYLIEPNPFGDEKFFVRDGSSQDEDGVNDGTIIITQIPAGMYNVTIITSKITTDGVNLISKEPTRTINVGVHSFNPTLTSVFREAVESGHEEPQKVDANFGEEFNDLVESDACIIDADSGECIIISDPNDLSYAIVGKENIQGINDLEPVQIVVNSDLIPPNRTFTIEDAENLLPIIKTPEPSLNQATLLPTLSINDANSDSQYAISSGVDQKDLRGNTVVVKVSEKTFQNGKGGVQQAIIKGAKNLETKSGQKAEVFSFKNSNSPGKLDDGTIIPRLPSIDNFLGVTNENNFETYIDVQTRFEQGNINSVNWHNPENFESSPIIRIIIPAIDIQSAQTDEKSGIEVFSMDTNDDMYLIPKPIIFMLDETLDPPQWKQEGAKIIHDTCKRINELFATCDAEFPHFSKFAIGGVKSLALGSLYQTSDGDNRIIKRTNQTLDSLKSIVEETSESVEKETNETPETDSENIQKQESTQDVEIPNWIKQPGYWWISGLITDVEFTNSLKYNIEKEIIHLEDHSIDEEITIIKAKNKVWDWSEGLIEDHEMKDVINFLIKDGT